MKKVIQYIIAIFLAYCSYFWVTNDVHPKYLDCGEVVSKSSDEVVIKHGTSTSLYLNVQFRKSGFRSIECEPTTYFSKKVGDQVCFDLKQSTTMWFLIRCIIGFAVVIILFAIVVVCFFNWLIPTSWW